MAVYSLNSYLSKVSQAWQVGEGDDLAALLSFQVGVFHGARYQHICVTFLHGVAIYIHNPISHLQSQDSHKNSRALQIADPEAQVRDNHDWFLLIHLLSGRESA